MVGKGELFMERYKNLGGTSGVAEYEIKNNSIIVKFNTGIEYVYSYRSAGNAIIEKMKLLASAGKGLNNYINKYVPKGYESKQG
jgi:hypothetical protein